jgi:hypothetical protein
VDLSHPGRGAEIYGAWDDVLDAFVPAVWPKPAGVVAIPATLSGLPLTSGGEYAFAECGGLTGMTFPAGVTDIGDYAFCGCSSLTSVTISNGVECIGEGAFYECSALASATIPDSVTNIWGWAFDDCNAALYDTNSIHGVQLVDGWAVGTDGAISGALVLAGIRGIGGFAFFNEDGMTRVSVADGVPYIGESAFEACYGLEYATVGNDVVSIGDKAFYDIHDAPIYVSDIYEDPMVSGMTVGLSLWPSAGQPLAEPTTITVTCADPGATKRYTTDGTVPTAASPVFSPFTLSSASSGRTATKGSTASPGTSSRYRRPLREMK